MKTLIAITVAALASSCLAEYGTFDTRQRAYPAGVLSVTGQSDFPMDGALADFDGDGNLDVALGCWGWWWPAAGVKLGNGAGGFGPASWYSVGTPCMSVEAGDLNGDGRPDFAVGEYNYGVGNRVAVFINNGNGTFATAVRYPCATGPRDIKFADMDLDGDFDIVSTGSSSTANAVSILKNNGVGNFSNRLDIPMVGTPHMLAVKDINGDLFPDIVTGRQFMGGSVLIAKSTGSLTYIASEMPVDGPQSSGTGVELGDLDDDGDADLIVGTGRDDYNIAGFRNDGSGNFGSQIDIPVPAFMWPMWDMEFVDMDHDGDKDIVGVAAANNDGFTILKNTGSELNFELGATEHNTGEENWGTQIADLNRDGWEDVVVLDAGSNHVTVHESNEGSFDFPPFYPINTAGIMRESAVGDVDGDGDLDFVSIGNRLVVMRNNGAGQFAVEVDDTALPPLDRPKLKDLDGDGDLDIITVKNLIIAQPPYDVYTSINDGTGNFGPFWIQSANGSAGIGEADAADLDGDGDLDLVASEGRGAPGMSRRIYSWENTGDPTYFAAPWILSNPGILGGERLALGDFNNDSKTDAMLGGQVLFTGVGDRTFAYHSAGDPGPGPIRGSIAFDLNQDGNLDIATASHGGAVQDKEVIGVRLGNGNGTFQTVQLNYGMYSRSLGGANNLDVVDANLDGKWDILASSYGSRDVTLFLGLGNGSFGPEQGFGINGSVFGVAAGDFNDDGRPDVALNVQRNLPNPSGLGVLFGMEPQLHHIVPTGFTVTQGTHFAGTLLDLFTSNNQSVQVLCDENAPNGQMIVTSQALGNTTTQLELTIRASAERSDLTLKVELFDYLANAWTTSGLYGVATTPSQFNVTTTNPGRFIHASTREVRARLTFIPSADDSSRDGWNCLVDQVVWKIRN